MITSWSLCSCSMDKPDFSHEEKIDFKKYKEVKNIKDFKKLEDRLKANLKLIAEKGDEVNAGLRTTKISDFRGN